jgi:hypothetical protein
METFRGFYLSWALRSILGLGQIRRHSYGLSIEWWLAPWLEDVLTGQASPGSEPINRVQFDVVRAWRLGGICRESSTPFFLSYFTPYQAHRSPSGTMMKWEV